MRPLLWVPAALAGAYLVKELVQRMASRTPGNGGGGQGGGGGSSFLPPAVRNGPARDQGVLDLIAEGAYVDPAFTAVSDTRDGRSVTIYASNDALRVGSSALADRPPRMMVSHRLSQTIADGFGYVLPTSRMSDMAWAASVRLAPIPFPFTGVKVNGVDTGMSSDATMSAASASVDKAVTDAGLQVGDFVRCVGKDWVTSELLLEPDGTVAKVRGEGGVLLPGTVAGCNFGWQGGGTSKSPGGVRVIQSPGRRHDLEHYDYSQVLCLYFSVCVIDDGERLVEEVLRDPASAYLLSDEVAKGTACKVTRHPALFPVA